MTGKLLLDLIKTSFKEKEMSEYKVAKLTGLNRSTVGRILSGQSSPSLENLEKIADIAGFELDLKNKEPS